VVAGGGGVWVVHHRQLYMVVIYLSYVHPLSWDSGFDYYFFLLSLPMHIWVTRKAQRR